MSALELAEQRARAAIGVPEQRSLGVVRAEDAAEFARAAGESAPHLVDPGHPGFRVHPLYAVSLLRGAPGAEPAEFRPDGMYRDEVPGTDGLDVRLMAGGQDVHFRAEVRPGDRIRMRRALTGVERKGGDAGFLLLTVEKTYAAERSALVEAVEIIDVTERFIVR
ncbi:MaoC family dehydratase N-terminal domain-containing protein [Streptomyces sp. NPDC006872]|uniref:FAS1-like dehydratase domain-containing protein n=1 Tax=Streptomyces sp. NPDC006872 TaxID=3155720 RepID=UPI0033D3371E